MEKGNRVRDQVAGRKENLESSRPSVRSKIDRLQMGICNKVR